MLTFTHIDMIDMPAAWSKGAIPALDLDNSWIHMIRKQLVTFQLALILSIKISLKVYEQCYSRIAAAQCLHCQVEADRSFTKTST